MRALLYPLLVVGLLACDGAPADAPETDDSANRATAEAAARAAAAAAPNAAAQQPATQAADQPDAQPMNPQTPPPPPQGGYELLGVIDSGINNVVAFALKIPRGWQAKQSFTRQWKGSAPYNQIYISLRSPDGADQIEYLPSTAYFYTDGPMARQMRQMAQQYGTQQQTPGELVSNGGRINQEITQRNHRIQRDAQHHQQETYAAVQRDRQASADRRAEAFGDALTGRARYDDPTTGERVRTDDYNHVYRDRQGTYYGTNTPVDAGQVDWQELQRVALKDY